jgi:hypothetical protein
LFSPVVAGLAGKNDVLPQGSASNHIAPSGSRGLSQRLLREQVVAFSTSS